MSTDSSNIDLQSCDMIYAISQNLLNSTLSRYLAQQARIITFAYDFDESGNLVAPEDPTDPDLSFSGTLAPVIDDSTETVLVPIVDMSSGALGSGQVQLQLTFAPGAVFQDRDRHGQRVTFTQGDPTANAGQGAWVIRLAVNLSKAALSDLPAAVQQNLDLLQGQYGDIFSVQQIFADLSSATLSGSVDESNAPAGIGVGYWDDLCQGIIGYLSEEKSAGQIPFGFVVTANAAPSATPTPALLPVNADVIILPNASNPGLSALVFTLVTGKDALPDQTTLYGEFAGIEMFDDPDDAQGYAIVSRAVFIDVLQAAFLNGATAAASSYVAVGLDDYGNPTFSVQQAAIPGTLTQSDPTAAANQSEGFGTILSFNFSTSSEDASIGAAGTASTSSSFTVAATVGTNEAVSVISVTGQFQISATHSYANNVGTAVGTTTDNMPQTGYPWSQLLEMTIDDDPTSMDPSTVVFVATSSDFDTPPTCPDISGWDKFWDALGGNPDVSSIGNIRSTVATYIQGNMEKALTTSLTGFSGFVMPGNDTFGFSGVRLNSAYNMVVDIAFSSPSVNGLA